MNNDINNNEEQNISELQPTEESSPKTFTIHTEKKKAIPIDVQYIKPSEKTNEISTVSLDKKETYRSIIELPKYTAFITLEFSKIAIFIILLMGFISGFAYKIYEAKPEYYLILSVFFVFNLIFLFALFKKNKERLKCQAVNEIVLKFAKEHRDFKITNREYLTFLLEHSTNYLIVKEAIYQEINKISTKGYSIEKFLKHDLHTTLKNDFSKMEKECIEDIKNKLFEDTYKGQ